MGTFRLWSDEIEAMRPEARAVIEAVRESLLMQPNPSPELPVAEQIAFALRQADSGTPVGEVCRKLGVSEQTFYRWKGLANNSLHTTNHSCRARKQTLSL